MSTKELVVTFIIALAASCVIVSIAQVCGVAPAYAPYPWATNIKDIKASSFGLKRDDFSIPEINYSDISRNSMYMTQIGEGTDERNVEFPYAAAN